MESIQTRDEAPADYLRLMQTTSQFNSTISSGINYQYFLSSNHILAYDLTTSNTPGNNIRKNLILTISFNDKMLHFGRNKKLNFFLIAALFH